MDLSCQQIQYLSRNHSSKWIRSHLQEAISSGPLRLSPELLRTTTYVRLEWLEPRERRERPPWFGNSMAACIDKRPVSCAAAPIPFSFYFVPLLLALGHEPSNLYPSARLVVFLVGRFAPDVCDRRSFASVLILVLALRELVEASQFALALP